MGFFGWKNGSMCQDYISSNKPTILGISSRLGGFEALSGDPLVELDEEKEKDTLDIKSMMPISNYSFFLFKYLFFLLKIRFSCLNIRFSRLNILDWVGLVWKSSPTS